MVLCVECNIREAHCENCEICDQCAEFMQRDGDVCTEEDE